MVNTALFAGRERVDVPDLTFATQDSIRSAQEQVIANLIARQAQSRVISGFVPSGSGQGPVVVGAAATPNVAILPYLVGSAVMYGRLACDAPASQSVSVSALASGTYSIFIRSLTQPETTQQRVFWDGSQLKEVAQLTPTRTVASWEARVESTAPSPEWVKIGEVTVTSAGSGQGSTITVVDQRPLYFEGTFDTQYKPIWGTAADRDLRRTATITDLATMIDALKQCVIDLKGPGVARWYDSFITGMNVGPGFDLTATVTANRFALGDASTYLETLNPNTSSRLLNLRYSPSDLLTFYGSSGLVQKTSSGSPVLSVASNGYVTIGNYIGSAPLTVNSTSGFGGGEVALFVNRGSGQTRAHLWNTSRTEISSAWGAGYLDEYPTPRALWTMGTSGGQILTGLLVNNLQGGNQFAYVFRAVSNSTASNDFTTYLQSKNVTIGSNGVVQLYSTLLYGSARFSSGSVAYASGIILCGTNGRADQGTFEFYGPSGYSGSSSVNPLPNPAGDNDNKFMRVTYTSGFPNNAIVQVTLNQYALDGTDQRDWTVSYRQPDRNTLDFALRGSDGKMKWGSFSFVVLNGSGN